MGTARTPLSGAATWSYRAGTLFAASQPAQVAALVKKNDAEMGSNTADGQLGKVLAQANGSLPDERLPLPRPTPHLQNTRCRGGCSLRGHDGATRAHGTGKLR